MRRRTLALAGLSLFAGAAILACVGDDPNAGSSSGVLTNPEGGGTGDETGGPLGDGGTPIDQDGGTTTDGGGDGGPTGPRCDPKKPFSLVKIAPGVNSAQDELDVFVTSDELTMYVTRSNGGNAKILKATRADREADFGPLGPAPELANINALTENIRSPSMTADGLVLFFDRGGTTLPGINVAFRPNKTAVFTGIARARSRGSALSEVPNDAFVSGSGNALMGASGPNTLEMSITQFPRDVAKTYGDGGFEDFAIRNNRGELETAGGVSRKPVLNRDATTIVFASSRAPATTTNLDIFIATRAGVAGTFLTPVRLADPVSSADDDRPGSLSDDECLLAFTSNRAGGNGGYDVWIARRPK